MYFCDQFKQYTLLRKFIDSTFTQNSFLKMHCQKHIVSKFILVSLCGVLNEIDHFVIFLHFPISFCLHDRLFMNGFAKEYKTFYCLVKIWHESVLKCYSISTRMHNLMALFQFSLYIVFMQIMRLIKVSQ